MGEQVTGSLLLGMAASAWSGMFVAGGGRKHGLVAQAEWLGPRPSGRRGLTLIEALVAGLLSLIVTGVYIGLSVYEARKQTGADNRLTALCSARLALETLVARPFDELQTMADPVRLTSLPWSTGTTEVAQTPFGGLPNAELWYWVRPASGGSERSVEVEVEAKWDEQGEPRKLTLVTARSEAADGPDL